MVNAAMNAEPVRIPDGDGFLSGLWLAPAGASAALTLAHGAGAAMTHRSMAAIAEGLAARGVATLRFNFPYMDKGSRRPDPPAVAHRAVRAAIAYTKTRAPELPLFSGGRSFGGRMTSQAEAAVQTSNLRGLIFFAFPLHPAGKPSIDRGDHLDSVKPPMLFLQGDNDALAGPGLLREVIARIGGRATRFLAEAADHSFHARAKSGRSDAAVMSEILDRARDWMAARS